MDVIYAVTLNGVDISFSKDPDCNDGSNEDNDGVQTFFIPNLVCDNVHIVPLKHQYEIFFFKSPNTKEENWEIQ